jgi:hypothetical protein
MTDLRLSNSEMKQWKRCRRQWYFGTYRGLKKKADDAPGSALSIGNSVHDALAAMYDPAVQADPVKFLTDLVAERIVASPTLEDDIKEEFRLTSTMVAGYVEWLEETGADQDLIIEGTESRVEVPLRDSGGVVLGVRLLSKLDAPVRRESDGRRLALEHKTTTSFDGLANGAAIDSQFKTEHLARFLHYIEDGAEPQESYDNCVGILLNMLKKVLRTAKAKPPFYDRLDVLHNMDELRNHWRNVVAIAVEIQSARAALDAGANHQTVCPPTQIPDRCKWDCPFFRVCKMADDGSDLEGALDAIYEVHDPLERYANSVELD